MFKIFDYFKVSKKTLNSKNEYLLKENYDLRKELEEAKSTINSLQQGNRENQVIAQAEHEELEATRKEVSRLTDLVNTTDYNIKAQVLRKLNELGEMNLEQLRILKCDFDVYPSSDIYDEYDFEDEKAANTDNPELIKWAVVTSYCQYGGCDLRTWFDDERSARTYAILRTEYGFPAGNGLCSSCRREYIASME